MKFWVDAQLPPLLAAWLSEQFYIEAFSLRALGLRDAADAAIFQAGQQQGIVIISKDSDFKDELKAGTFHAMLKQLGIKESDLHK